MARYERAMKLYDGRVLFHDVAGKNSVVHTDYEAIASRGHDRLILTHSPDRFVSQHMLTLTGKTLRVIGQDFFEEVNGDLWELDADIYCKAAGDFYAGYRNSRGSHNVYVKNGILGIAPVGTKADGEIVMRVNLYVDMQGHYLPPLESPNERYQRGPDGRFYHVSYTRNGGRMRVVESVRGQVPELRRRRRKVHV
jgi:hypothetical protein